MELKNLIWYEKYRPRRIKDLILDDHIEEHLSKYIKLKEVPHLLLFGPPGSGKTTICNIIIEKCASSSLILNASSEDRGVETIKKKVKQFASNLRMDKEKINIVFMDESDGLTFDSQIALKNTIETYHKNCRFLFTANRIEKIIPEIQSRFIKLRFNTLPKDSVLENCIFILKRENVKYKEKDVVKVIDKFYPDIRSIINELQSCSISGNLDLNQLGEPEINLEELNKLIDKGKIGEIRKLWAGMYDFSWLYRFLIDQYIVKIKNNEKAGNCALSIADYQNRYGDKEINATACLVDIMIEQDINIYF